MSTVDIFLSSLAPARVGAWRRSREGLARVFSNAFEEWIVKRAIAELQGLDDHMLRDIGFTRGEIESCVRHSRQNRRRDLTKRTLTFPDS